MCKAIDNPELGNDTFAKLYGAANIYYNYTGNVDCFNITNDSDKHGLDEWTWQVSIYSSFNLFINSLSISTFFWHKHLIIV